MGSVVLALVGMAGVAANSGVLVPASRAREANRTCGVYAVEAVVQSFGSEAGIEEFLHGRYISMPGGSSLEDLQEMCLSISCGCFGEYSFHVSWIGAGAAALSALLMLAVAILHCAMPVARGSPAHCAPNASARVPRGFSAVELMCVLAIIAALLGLLLPALQQTRESARQVVCKNRLRALGVAAQNYASRFRKLPPGTLGFKDVIVSDLRIRDAWEDPRDKYYWKRAPHTSAAAFLLSDLGENSLYALLPKALFEGPAVGLDARRAGYAWIGDDSAIRKAMETPVSSLFCPSDDLSSGLAPEQFGYVSAQPVFLLEEFANADGVMPAFLEPRSKAVAASNYLGCAGAHSGGAVPDARIAPYRGAFGCRESVRYAEISDGLSHTLLFGETVGMILDHERVGAFVWCVGGIGRGRGKLPWGHLTNPDTPEAMLFGDATYSHITSFGSKHPRVVNVVHVDGSVHGVDRAVELDAWYARCGIQDAIVSSDQP